MPPPDPYSRSYWRFADEFPEIYADDSAYALWSRLRDEADKAWPSSAPLPYGVKKRALAMLVDAQLVYPQPGHRYRIRGLDKERERRAEPARRSANARWDRLREQEASDAATDREGHRRSADAMRTHSERNAEAMLAKPRRDETSKDEPRRALSAREGLPHITPEVQAVGESIAGAGILSAGDKQLTELDRLCEQHGGPAVVDAMQSVAGDDRKSWRQLVWDSVKRLEPFSNGRKPSEDDEVAELSRKTKREFEEFQRREASRA